MRVASFCRRAIGVSTAFLAAAANAHDVDTRWRLTVADLHHQRKVEATLRFTNDPAQSCMGGTWKRVLVEEEAVRADSFFPLNSPLAYKLENGILTLGRTDVCDGYLFLTGRPQGPMVQGSYDAVGWGSRQLGAFSLQQIQPIR